MQKTVLLVDDESAILRAWRRLLRNEGYRLLLAEDADSALAQLNQEPIAVVLSDFRMPGLNGGQLAKLVAERSPATVCLLISGYAELNLVLDALNSGQVYRFLTKPWDDEGLRREIRQAVTLHEFKQHWLQQFGGQDDAPVSAMVQSLGKQGALEQQWLAQQLSRAIDEEQLHLVYQPKVFWPTKRVDSAEVLVRWQHPELGVVPPLEFIPVAESTGVISALGEWVLDEACRQLAQWCREGVAPARLAVNVSAAQLKSPDLPERFATILGHHGIQPQQIDLEVTESCMIGDMAQSLEIMADLRALGFRLHLDDFGTGYSSLYLLRQLPVSTLKIPKEFMTTLTSDATGGYFVGHIIQLARSLGLEIVAEGVESTAQAELLVELGCDTIQGYLFSVPLLPEQFALLMASAPEGRVAVPRSEVDVLARDGWIDPVFCSSTTNGQS